MGNFALDTAFSAAVGCAGSVVSGGKCANGAITAAFASLYNGDGARKRCIAVGAGCKISLRGNPNATAKAPWYEFKIFSTFERYNSAIIRASQNTGVNADLIRSIMFMETTHGYYDAIPAILDVNKSVLPMNINTDYWGGAFGSRSSLQNPEANIMAGAAMLRNISRVMSPITPVSHIATIYNNSNATQVSNYGARVGAIYRNKPWR
ncbi:MAG: hypothetical protein ACRBCJ_09350 [Hyphomicrobiaceae bacterium]